MHNAGGGTLSEVVDAMVIVGHERMRTVCGVFTERSVFSNGKIPKDDRLC